MLSCDALPAPHAADPAPRPLPTDPWSRGPAYRGPERRRGHAPAAGLLAQVLDEVDYGLLLLDAGRRVLHVNHAARGELGRTHPLQLLGGELRARLGRDVAPLHEAVAGAAQRGLRRLLLLGDAQDRVEVSVVPLGTPGAPGAATDLGGALLVLGRREVCSTLSVQGFARAHGLSPGEELVLRGLCEGLRPVAVAERHGVKIATVRTQIAHLRAKTGAPSINALVQQVATLPPLVSALGRAATEAGPTGLVSAV